MMKMPSTMIVTATTIGPSVCSRRSRNARSRRSGSGPASTGPSPPAPGIFSCTRSSMLLAPVRMICAGIDEELRLLPAARSWSGQRAGGADQVPVDVDLHRHRGRRQVDGADARAIGGRRPFQNVPAGSDRGRPRDGPVVGEGDRLRVVEGRRSRRLRQHEVPVRQRRHPRIGGPCRRGGGQHERPRRHHSAAHESRKDHDGELGGVVAYRNASGMGIIRWAPGESFCL